MIRVFIVDDHPVVRAGIRQIVSEAFNLCVAGEAASGEQAITGVRSTPCDVVCMDISMPGRGGLDALKQIRAEHPRLPVLILSIYEEADYAIRALKGGASGYLTKRTVGDDLVAAIGKVAAGENYISPAVAEKIAEGLRHNTDRPPHDGLSDREFEVLRGIAMGKTVTQLAEELSLSKKTISTYRARLLDKMGLHNNAELMHYAMQHGLV